MLSLVVRRKDRGPSGVRSPKATCHRFFVRGLSAHREGQIHDLMIIDFGSGVVTSPKLHVRFRAVCQYVTDFGRDERSGDMSPLSLDCEVRVGSGKDRDSVVGRVYWLVLVLEEACDKARGRGIIADLRPVVDVLGFS